MGNWKFNVNRSENVFKVVLSGQFNESDAMSYVQAYQNEINKFDPTRYSLVFDCGMLDIGTKDSAKTLEGCFVLYKQANYKLVSAILYKPQKYLKGQFEELAAKAGLHNFKVIFE